MNASILLYNYETEDNMKGWMSQTQLLQVLKDNPYNLCIFVLQQTIVSVVVLKSIEEAFKYI